MKQQGYVINFINEAFKHCKAIGATGEAVGLLAETGIADVKLAESTSKKGVVSDKGVVTSQAAPTDEFNLAFTDAIAKHRHWIREKNENLPA
jgi:catalase